MDKPSMTPETASYARVPAPHFRRGRNFRWIVFGLFSAYAAVVFMTALSADFWIRAYNVELVHPQPLRSALLWNQHAMGATASYVALLTLALPVTLLRIDKPSTARPWLIALVVAAVLHLSLDIAAKQILVVNSPFQTSTRPGCLSGQFHSWDLNDLIGLPRLGAPFVLSFAGLLSGFYRPAPVEKPTIRPIAAD